MRCVICGRVRSSARGGSGRCACARSTPTTGATSTWCRPSTMWRVRLSRGRRRKLRRHCIRAPGCGLAPLTVEELVEDLAGYLASFGGRGEIDQAGKGAQNKALEMAQHCLSDFTYRQADLYRRCSGWRSAGPEAASEPQVNGDRALPSWAQPATVEQTAADVVEVHGTPSAAPAAPGKHPQHDELF